MEPCAARNAVVWSGGDARVTFMVSLALRTIEQGLRANGFNVTMGSGARRLHASSSSGALATLRDNRDLFVWVGMFDHVRGLSDAKRMRKLGVRTAFYGTESHMIWDKKCTIITSLEVDEIWQYTHSNIARCPESKIGKPARYVPPGYLPREHMAAEARMGGSSKPPPLRALFLGGFQKFYNQRRFCIGVVQTALVAPALAADREAVKSGAARLPHHRALGACPGDVARVEYYGHGSICPLQSAYNAYDDSSWDRYVAMAPYFLNVHKSCNATARVSEAACESFRLSMLLAAGGLVFSEHCHPLDEMAYAGLVRFGAVDELGSAMIAEHAVDMAEADYGAARRRKRLDEFALRFSPSAIFERAGLITSLRRSCTTT